MFSTILKAIKGNAAAIQKEDVNERKKNPINELQVLEGHTDIVRTLLRIDNERFASAGDDATAIVWSSRTGTKLHTFVGHTLPITCMMALYHPNSTKLITGSADKTIRIWDLATGDCEVLKHHTGSLKCLVEIDSTRFVSGSNDRQLCIWTYIGPSQNGSATYKATSVIERQEEENLHCMIPIIGNRLITGSNSSLLFVYRVDTCTYEKVLAYHRESVRTLININDKTFASGSMDGGIVLWNSDTLTPFKVLHNPEKYRNENRVYIYDVKYLMTLGEKYLAAGIGNGYRIYDLNTGDCAMECKDAHQGELNNLIPLYDGTRIVTSSTDSTVRLWGTSQKINFGKKANEGMIGKYDIYHKVSEPSYGELTEKSKKKRTVKVESICLGEMWGHTDSVNHLIQISESSFASCSSDTTVILWKDGRQESEHRNKVITQYIQREIEAFQTGVPTDSQDFQGFSDTESDTDEFYSEYSEDNVLDTLKIDVPIDMEDIESNSSHSSMQQLPTPEMASMASMYPLMSSTPPTPPSQEALNQFFSNLNHGNLDNLPLNLLPPPKNVRVPDYIWDNVNMLIREKKYTLEQITEHLKKQGHSDSLIATIVHRIIQQSLQGTANTPL